MKRPAYGLLALGFLFSLLATAQNPPIRLKTGAVIPAVPLSKAQLDSFQIHALRTDGKAFGVLQFSSLPTAESRKLLAAQGIELLDYLPEQAYTATFSGPLEEAGLRRAGVRFLLPLTPRQKMDARLAANIFPAAAVRVGGTVDLWISFPRSFAPETVLTALRSHNIDIISDKLAALRIVHLRIAQNRVAELAAQPFVEWVQPAPGGDQPLNFNARMGSRANVLNQPIANGGRGLNGEGVVIGVGDNADVTTHIDFAGRIINRSGLPTGGGHGHHVTGTVGGAGNGNEIFRGYAPRATIVSQAFNGVILNAGAYVNDYGMVITNNSYGDNIECGYMGAYDLYSRLLDQMAFDYPNLEHVFSAGNSGSWTCPPFQPFFHTVLGGYQSAKNVLTVGATTDSGALGSFSSRGPVRDGRLKPEITTQGQLVASTWAGNIYGFNNGTSMSAPGVAGGLALLYQRFRQLNSGVTPRNALMKALLCNGASDRGNPGPDFGYGFGWMNLLRSVDMMENNRYLGASVAQGGTNNHPILVPANTHQLKVMLYWNDPAASMLTGQALVNNLDLELVDGAGNVVLPGILDTSNANLNNAAFAGVDRINNIEQVVIQAPAAGTFTIRVKGTALAQGPQQEYFVVWDPVPVQLRITSPSTGEAIIPSSSTEPQFKISWESTGLTGTGNVEFSADNGASWTTLAANVNINRPVLSWWVPNVATDVARIRVTKNGTGETSVSGPFTIINAPQASLDPVQCEGYIRINWTAVPGATDYEVMRVIGTEMQSVGFTTGTTWTFSGLSKDSTYWVTVRSRVNGKAGRRTYALRRMPNSGTCTGSISDNDLKLDAILAPKNGRRFTSTQLGNSQLVTVRVRNLDDVPVTGFTLKYSINGGPLVTETVSGTIAAGGTYDHSFSTTADLASPGDYQMTAIVQNLAADPVTANDSAFALVRHLDNQPIAAPFTDNLEAGGMEEFTRDTIGLGALSRYDLARTSAFGRARAFVNSGMASSGQRALTLDTWQFTNAGNTNYLYGTFNLINYNAAVNDIRLDFRFNNHGQQLHPNNKVWVRGNDMQPWVEVYDLDSAQNDPGTYRRSASLEIGDALVAAAQNFGTSFQVRWGQWGQAQATDKENFAGYSFDDIRFYEVVNDIQMRSLDAPTGNACGLTGSSVITVSVRNSANTPITNIPVRYRVNGGGWVAEVIPVIGGNATVQYSFNTAANLSAFGTYTIQTLVDLPGDSFRENDTLTTPVIHSPVISSFPYLQNFEADNGYWYAGGKKSSWAYGTPNAQKINRAASGARAWKTRLSGNYNDLEHSYLYSPCFDLTGMTRPTLSFSLALDIEDCGTQLCDGAWVEYSTDGLTWQKLGAPNQGANWYNKANDSLWSIQNYTRWHVASIPLPQNVNRLRLRFVLKTDQAANREGVGIDDIHIFDRAYPIYNGVSTPAITQTPSGNGWTDFVQGGAIVASIRANGQPLGQTSVQAYIFSDSVRNTGTQFYAARNLTIKPATTYGGDSVSVRFFFLDSESDSVVLAKNCAACARVGSAYEFGISKYTDPDKTFENGTVLDNQQGLWQYIANNQVTIVPYDRGYYAEFKVKDFSEFWLNNGGFDRASPLPVKLMELTAQKSGNDVLLRWRIASESNVVRYEIEVARGQAELQAGNWSKLGEVLSGGNTTSARNYQYTDVEPDKFGTRFYRLKVIHADGSFVYSPVRLVVFDDAVLWQVYPNPSTGLFSLVYQLAQNEELFARVLDAKGAVLGEYRRTGNGGAQKLQVDLTTRASGVYLLEVRSPSFRKAFKLYKQ